MSADPKSLIRRHLRFVRHLPVRCAALSPKPPYLKPLIGKTRSIGAGGLAILLPESLPVSSALLLQISEKDPVRGTIVWAGEGTPTLMGIRFLHGVAFEQPVDAALVRQWVSQSNNRLHARAPVRFDVEYTQAQTIVRGTCLTLSRGGMFITTRRPAVPGPEVMLHFTLPDLPDRLSALARVVWVSRDGTAPIAITGMGVQFLELETRAAAMIDTTVDRLCRKASPPPTLPRLPPPR